MPSTAVTASGVFEAHGSWDNNAMHTEPPVARFANGERVSGGPVIASVTRANLKMPITETVVTLAKCVAEARSPLTDWERSLYDALLKMPKFREQNSLDGWEKQFLEALATGEFVEESSNSCMVTSHLLKEIFELGRYNLYTAFDTPGVRRELNALVRCLRVNHNIEPPTKLDVSEW